MTSAGDDALDTAASAVRLLESLPLSSSEYREVDDSWLLKLNQVAARAREVAAAVGAIVAGEIARRSSPTLGSAGLAQRSGFRTPEELLKSTTRVTARQAVASVRIGRIASESDGAIDDATGESRPPQHPWLSPMVNALAAGELTVEAADAIRVGVGVPSSSISESQLRFAVETLVAEAGTVDPDRLFRRARALRDELDLDGIAVREEERRQQRSLRITVLPTGMGRLVWTMHPEALATVKDLYDRLTSPKRGGVRFVADARAQRVQNIIDDSRSPEQLASDGFEQLLRLGADADSRHLIGSGAPVITVTTTKSGLMSGVGFGRLEGQPDAVSMPTIERMVCAGGVSELTFDDHGQPLNLGREHRLFSRRQRKALAIRDGGCRAPNCDRPPSWTEAHHIDHWSRDGGATDIANGILLCKHHHLLFHNNHWEIERDYQAQYWLIPPKEVDPSRTRRLMPTKSTAFADLQRA